MVCGWNHHYNKIHSILAAHQYLCETLHILHRDISIGNILLYRAEEDQEATGLLIDFDFSTSFNPEEASESVPEDNQGEPSEAHSTFLSNDEVDEVNEDHIIDAASDDEVVTSTEADNTTSNNMIQVTTDVEDCIWTVGTNFH